MISHLKPGQNATVWMFAQYFKTNPSKYLWRKFLLKPQTSASRWCERKKSVEPGAEILKCLPIFESRINIWNCNKGFSLCLFCLSHSSLPSALFSRSLLLPLVSLMKKDEIRFLFLPNYKWIIWLKTIMSIMYLYLYLWRNRLVQCRTPPPQVPLAWALKVPWSSW